MKEQSIEAILAQYFKSGTEAFLPHVSINNVVLGYDHPHLKVLVHRMPDQQPWILPGGYLKYEEDLEDAAYRNLRMSGIDHVFLRQIQTFGDVHRVPEYAELKDAHSSRYNEIMRWASKRFVTVVYYGLVNYKKTKLTNGGISSESKWMDVNKPEKLAADHESIVSETRKILVTELLNQPIALNLLPDSFSINELRGLYEAILNRSIDRGTFRRKMMKQGIVEQIGKRKDTVGRPSDIFRFKKDVYLRSLDEEAKFGF